MTGAARKLEESSWATSQATDRSPESRAAWNYRVLIVEDEPSISDAYKDILGAQAQKVVPIRRSSRSATQGSAAVDLSREEAKPAADQAPMNFELTFVSSADKAIAEVKHAISIGRPYTMGFFDVLLGGGMDGIELVKKLLEIDPNIHAVFVTAYSDRSVDSIQSFLGEDKASQWDYLTKPFTHGEILQKARAGVTMWNLKREKETREEHLEALQKQLRESERHASAAAVARGIGHEFRNVLTLIIGHAELGSNQGTETQMKRALQMVLQAGERAEEILDRFKYLSAPSERTIAKKRMLLHEPVDQAMALLNHQLKTNNVRVCWIRKNKVALDLNATSLIQVIVNLTLNAIHAMGSSGQIDISIAELGNRAELRFRDYGPGVDPKIVSRITEPFFTTKGENGTGLGLAIAKEIVEMEHEGEFKAGNHEIKGFEVTMSFPLARSEGENG